MKPLIKRFINHADRQRGLPERGDKLIRLIGRQFGKRCFGFSLSLSLSLSFRRTSSDLDVARGNLSRELKDTKEY